MGFEPQKFFLGVIDFFAVLLPGAIVTFVLAENIGPQLLGASAYEELSGAAAATAFLVVSYVVGQLVFAVGSLLDEPYDWLRRRSVAGQIRRLADEGTLPPRLVRAMVRLTFKVERDRAVERASALRRADLDLIGAADALNTFQWSKALLALESPAELAAVERLEADSKLFRCLTVVLAGFVLAWPWQSRWPVVGLPIAIGLLLLSFWRYAQQRLKATNHAYRSALTLASRTPRPAYAAFEREGASGWAGGAVMRRIGERTEFLLVTAHEDAGTWVVPKGRVRPGEPLRHAAIREVVEEAGTWARIVGDPSQLSYTLKDGRVVEVKLFPMERVANGPTEDRRRTKWLDANEATHEETRRVLDNIAATSR